MKNLYEFWREKYLLWQDCHRAFSVGETPPKEMWKELFLREEYGVRPAECDRPLRYEIIEEKDWRSAHGQKIKMFYNDLPMEFHLWAPKGATGGVKCFVLPLHPSAYEKKDIWAHPENIVDYCPIEDVTKRGFGVAIILCGDVAEDRIGGEHTGIFASMKCARTADSWGVLSAWAWSASKVADYLVRDERFDKNRLAVIGHSRGGKTALLAGVTDERFFLSVSSCSGNSGAALSRGNKGETVADIVKRFPYWFCENYKKYADNEDVLPFDQHLFLSLLAPRKCYVVSATMDAWADPAGELASAKKASLYYEQAGVRGLVVPEKTECDRPYHGGNIAYHRHRGVHELNPFDWKLIMDYFSSDSSAAHGIDRLYSSRWGVFIHYLDAVQNDPAHPSNMNVGKTDWNACVNDLDVGLLARQLHECGARFLFFTVMQGSRFMIAPNKTYDTITGMKPGEACCKRDLISDLYDALTPYGIDLYLYSTGDGPHSDPVCGPKMGFVKGRVSLAFVKNWASVMKEYALRYGDKIKGWWFDGCYRSAFGYTDKLMEIYYNAVKEGNPNAIVAFNNGVAKYYKKNFRQEDFTCGEFNSFTVVPRSRYIRGAQAFLLAPLGQGPEKKEGSDWSYPGARYDGKYMRDFITRCSDKGGAVAVEIAMKRDGGLYPEQLSVLKRIEP